MNESLDRLRLLLWKNWVMQRRRRKKLLMELIIPLFIGSFLLYVRYAAEIYEGPQMIYTSFTPDYVPIFPNYIQTRSTNKSSSVFVFNSKDANGLSFTGLDDNFLSHPNESEVMTDGLEDSEKVNASMRPRAFIVWSPDTSKINEIMLLACNKMRVVGQPLKNSSALEKFMTTKSDLFPRPRDMILAGVVFPDDVTEKIPRNLEIKIRFPAELRTNSRPGPAMLPRNWLTGLVFPMIQIPGPRPLIIKTGSPGYYEEGFLGIQNAISASILELENQKNETFDIKLKMYPYGEHVIDTLIIVMQNALPFLITVSFLFPVKTMVERITTEKEKRLKVVMNIMGLSDSLRWTSWFVYSFLFFGFLVIVLLIVFKVPFVYNRAVFPHSDWTCLALFFICYTCATITFCFLISSLFTKASIASILAGMIWFLVFLPFYVIQQKYAEIGTVTKCLFSLFLNTGMGIGLQIILMFEGAGIGCQWSNFTKPATTDDGMTMMLLICMLILDCIIHLCLAMYIENIFPGECGTPLPWYYPFQRSYWYRGEQKITYSTDENLNSSDSFDYPMEEPQKNLPAGIRIKNLRKIYKKSSKPAVKNLCFDAFEGQISVLMGFNGAGKTTTLSILTGIYPPTSGTAIVAGFDVRTNIRDVRRNLGFCPQYNVLFDEMTVEEHLRFFGKLRGLNNKEVKSETDRFLTLLNFKDKKHTLAKHLSGGMKRKLSVTLAMCGNVKVILLDEPTAGMDPRARRSLWDLLIAAKKGKTILITTHHLDEADLLGDRVAIMSEGKLNCNGSTFFLKKHFSCGYHLVIVKDSECNVKEVIDLIQSHIPETLKFEDVGMEVTCQLPEKYSSNFEELFTDIENEKEKLKITGFGVTPTSLEDVFKSIADGESNQNGKQNGTAEAPETTVHTYVEVRNNKEVGCSLLRNQIKSMFYKHAISTKRTWLTYLMLICITLIGTGLGIFTVRVNNQLLNLPPRELVLKDFPEGIVSVQKQTTCTQMCERYYETYADTIEKQNMNLMKLNNTLNIDNYLIGLCDENVFSYRTNNILATSFDQKGNTTVITGWFNGIPYHVPPIALSNIYNSLYKMLVKYDGSVTFVNEPLPYRDETKIDIQGSALDTGFQIAIFVSFTFIFSASFFIVFLIQERGSKAKLLQFVSGVGSTVFWLTAYAWNLLLSLGPNAAVLAVLATFQEEGFDGEQIGYCAVALLCFFISVLPLIFVASLIFAKPAVGFIIMSFFNIITGIYTIMLVVILQIPILKLKHVSEILDWVFSIFPLYSLGRSFQNIQTSSSLRKLCKPIYEQYCIPNENFIHVCCKVPEKCPDNKCLEWTDSTWDWNLPGFGRFISFSFIVGATLLIILLLIENGTFNFLKRKGAAVPDLNRDMDSDVMAEREKVNNISEKDRQNYSILIQGISKTFKKHTAVNNLYLAVPKGESFGLLGTNGAGKTTTFRMLTGDECPSSGNAYLMGLSLKKNLKEIHKLIGYCPQFDALFDNMTGREHLRMYCLLRGVPECDIDYTSMELAKELLFEQFLDKKVGEYSGGNKRKLSTALALIGRPPVVYLDEPTAGIDPVAKRHLWAVITKLRKRGTTIILTSHSMEECEALCTRLTIMANGEFKCLGSSQYLKNKFCQGYSLAIKVRKKVSGPGDNAQDTDVSFEYYVKEIKQFIATNFPGATQSEEHDELLVYRIPFENVTWSKMFGLVESVKDRLNIEDYSIGQTTLEQILLKVTGSSDTD